MIHALFGSSATMTGGFLDYHCVACGCFVAREAIGYLEYLVRTQERCFCGVCDPLPDRVPSVLRERGEGLACLLSINSTDDA